MAAFQLEDAEVTAQRVERLVVFKRNVSNGPRRDRAGLCPSFEVCLHPTIMASGGEHGGAG